MIKYMPQTTGYVFEEITAQEFDNLAKNHPLASMFQDSRWAEVKSDNWQAKFLALRSGNKIVVASLVLIRSLPLRFQMWYLPRGPLFDPTKPAELKLFSEKLKQLARSERCLLLKIDPNLIIKSTSFEEARATIDQPRPTDLVELFQSAGWRHFGFNKAMKDTTQPRFNATFYITENWENKIAKKTRKFIRKGEELGVAVKEISLEQIDDLVKLIQATASAKQISLRDRDYFAKIKRAFGDDCLLTLTTFDPAAYQKLAQQKLTEVENQLAQTSPNSHTILNQLKPQKRAAERLKIEADSIAKEYKKIIHLSASLSILNHGQLEMLYSGMDRKFDKFYAPHIADKWRIAWAEKRGAKTANFGGIDGSLNDSLSKFKAVFGTNVDEYIGEFNLYTYPILSWSFDKLLPGVKKILLKFRR